MSRLSPDILDRDTQPVLCSLKCYTILKLGHTLNALISTLPIVDMRSLLRVRATPQVAQNTTFLHRAGLPEASWAWWACP